MSRRSARVLVDDMLARCDRISRHLADTKRETFLADEKTLDAVVRCLEIIGEAANRVPEDVMARHASVPWRRIVGLRHRIVHDYFEVDAALVFEIAHREIPILQEALRALRKDLPPD